MSLLHLWCQLEMLLIKSIPTSVNIKFLTDGLSKSRFWEYPNSFILNRKVAVNEMFDFLFLCPIIYPRIQSIFLFFGDIMHDKYVGVFFPVFCLCEK